MINNKAKSNESDLLCDNFFLFFFQDYYDHKVGELPENFVKTWKWTEKY